MWVSIKCWLGQGTLDQQVIRPTSQHATCNAPLRSMDMLEPKCVSTWQNLADPPHTRSFDLRSRCEPRKTQESYSRVDYFI